MKTEFPACLEIAKRLDQETWAIGDAMLIDVGQPGSDGAPARFRECIRELDREGLITTKLKAKTFRQLWHLAANFPPERRRLEVGWRQHHAAGSPDMLDAIVDGYKDGPVTVKICEAIVKAWRRGL